MIPLSLKKNKQLVRKYSNFSINISNFFFLNEDIIIDSWNVKQSSIMSEFFKKIKKKPLNKDSLECIQTMTIIYKILQCGGESVKINDLF